jgi:hypothetical protein
MIHNIIEVDGVEYQAVAGDGGRCAGCVGVESTTVCIALGSCAAIDRKDKSEAIFKRRINIKELQNAN